MKEEKLSNVTLEILDRSEKLKWIIMGEMIIGDSMMISAINTCEFFAKKINPQELNDVTFEDIMWQINQYYMQEEEKYQKISKYIHAGIYRFHMMLEAYLKEIKVKKLVKEL